MNFTHNTSYSINHLITVNHYLKRIAINKMFINNFSLYLIVYFIFKKHDILTTTLALILFKCYFQIELTF